MIGGSLAIKKYDPSIIPYLSNPSETLVQKDSRNENINSTTYVIPKPVSNSAMVKGKDPTNIDVKAIEQMNISDNSRIFTIKSGGFDRTYNIHIPITYDRSKLISLLFAFHGAGDDGLGMEKYSGLSELADNSNVLVVYPNGYKMYWSDGRGMAPGDSEGINDVQFVTNMIADISSKYHIDSTKIYATGFSSGGFFVHKLACELSDKIFGFVAVSAALADNIAKNCSNKVSHPFMMIMGTNDVAYNST